MLPLPLPEGVDDVPLDTMSVGQILYGLFFQPHVLLWLQRNSLGKAFRFASVACIVVGVALGVCRVPSILHVTQKWAVWLGREVEELTLREGELTWKRPERLPYTTRHEGWRIDFAAKGEQFVATEIDGPEERGLWFSPDRVLFWMRPNHNSPVPVRLLDEGKTAWGMIDTQQLYPGGLTLKGDEFRTEARRAVWQFVPVFLIQQALLVFVSVMFYVFVFAAMPVLMHRLSGGTTGFRRLFTFYLYASVPPLCAAGVYASLRLPHLDLGTAFVLAFVIYLLLVFVSLRDVLNPQGHDAR